ncbi:DUF6049 family protein [Microbacterium allomyrinae]|uniref:2-oxoglutarate dehydrogenase n=1 Tax=Microbacterium allomyrinae TaxID=2830666 RepID=A0A9X1S480_9MICO|nr:DUF6049 family protein [Microbacterium allomyrinae]MCC2032788.1 hypothetical protein [Microbacterium allomyrinae]
MTVTPPGTPARRRAPRLAAAVFGALAIVGTLLVPGVASAAPTPEPTPTASIAAGTTVFTLAPVSNGVVRAGDPLTVSVTLQNATDAATAPAEITLSLGSTPLRDRQALTEWLDGATAGAALDPVGTVVLDPVAPGAEETTGIGLAAEDPALAGRAPGVYPLAASYSTGTGVVTSTSAMIVPSDGAGEVGIGVLVPITAEPIAEGLLTADELSELTAPSGALTSQLDGVDGTAAILAVDPAIPAAIRVLGTTAPATALAWLERLEALPNSRFALQFGDADVTAQLEAGVPRPLSPGSLTAYMNPSDFPSPTPSPTATEGATAGAAAPSNTPTTSELLSIGPSTRDGVYWPAGGTAGPDVVAQLGEIVVDGRDAITVIPSTSTAGGADGSTVAARGLAGDADVLVYDTDASDALYEASLREKSSLRGAPLTAATAYLAFATAEADGPVLVSLGRSAERSRVGLGTAITTATTAPNVSPRTLGGLAASPALPVEVQDAAAAPERVAAASDLVADESEVARFATILDDASLLTGPERAELLQLLGVSWIGHADWATALADHRVTTAETLDSVSLLPTSALNLYGSSASLRFWVRNDLDYPVNLVLYTTPDDLRLDVQRETPIVATPSSNTRVDVPVQARVGSGEVTLALQLRSPAFVAVGAPESVDVNVRAEWEAFGIAALSVVVGALLIVGVARTVLRMRRRGRPTDAAASADDGEGAADVGVGDTGGAETGATGAKAGVGPAGAGAVDSASSDEGKTAVDAADSDGSEPTATDAEHPGALPDAEEQR